MGLRNSLDDDQLHMPIMEPSETHEMGGKVVMWIRLYLLRFNFYDLSNTW